MTGLFVFGDRDTTLILDDSGNQNLVTEHPPKDPNLWGGIDDNFFTSPQFTFGDDSMVRNDTFFYTDPYSGQVTGSGTYKSTFYYYDVGNVQLLGGKSGNEFDVRSTSVSTLVTIFAGSDADTIQVGESFGGRLTFVDYDGVAHIFGANGDLNGNNVVDFHDADILARAVATGNQNPLLDIDQDGQVNRRDLTVWVKDLARTWFGDANLDGIFDSSDLIAIMQAGKFERAVDALWSEGDWNGDGRFDTSDLIAAFQDGGYRK
jgi:hypothetical protein